MTIWQIFALIVVAWLAGVIVGWILCAVCSATPPECPRCGPQA